MTNIIILSIFTVLLISRILLTQYKINTFKIIITPFITSMSLIIALLNYIGDPSHMFIILFLLWSITGDTLNGLGGDYLFYGMIQFFIAHIMLIVSLVLSIDSFDIGMSISTAFVLLILFIILYFKMYPNLKIQMKIGIPFYILISGITLVLVLNIPFSLLTIGVLLFIVSDIILATFTFIPKDYILYNKLGHILVWITYAPGLMLIAQSTYFSLAYNTLFHNVR